MRILITGASGFIGRHLVSALATQGHEVIGCVRTARSLSNLAGVNPLVIDYNQALTISDWLPHLENIDLVINAVGIIKESRRQRFDVIHTQAPCALFRACE